MGDKAKGLFSKFEVRRTDGTDGVHQKHDGCQYFVLDLTHDRHAAPALRAYADSAKQDGFVLLAKDLDRLAARIEAGERV